MSPKMGHQMQKRGKMLLVSLFWGHRKRLRAIRYKMIELIRFTRWVTLRLGSCLYM